MQNEEIGVSNPKSLLNIEEGEVIHDFHYQRANLFVIAYAFH